MRPPCIACLHHPEHVVDMGDGTEVTLCAAHWDECEARLGAMHAQWNELLDSGVHPAIAERMLTVAL